MAKKTAGARISVRIGKSVAVDARIDPPALLAIGAMVSGILLGTAAIVRAAGTGKPRISRNRRLSRDGTAPLMIEDTTA